jgi:outer membrane protein assembly factor BamB
VRRIAFTAALLLTAFSTRADDWPHWRGPKRNGISAETGWTTDWPKEGPRVAWKARVGIGFSSFAVAGGRVFTLGNANNHDTVWCLDATTGQTIWKHSYESDLGDKYFEGGTGSTPSVDGERVFTTSRWGDIFCFEAATGKIVWSKNFAKEADLRVPGWGFTGSPLIHEKLVVLNAGEGGLALDKSTGAIAWKSKDNNAGYSTPLPVRRGADWLALLSNESAYLAVELGTGKPVWRFRWLTEYGVNAADPVLAGNQIFISSGYGKGGALLRLGASEPEVVWRSKVLRTQMNPAIFLGGFFYGVDGDSTDKAVLKCIEAATGKERWERKNFGSGALTAADDKLIALSERGEFFVAPATPDAFKPIAQAQVIGGKNWTVPVLANGRIHCRNARGDVVCLDVGKK